MTREEQILKAARDYNSGITLSSPSNVIHFENGAAWADAHQINVWHDASEMPKENEWVLAQFNEMSYETFFMCPLGSAWCKDINLTRWAYVKDLLTKGGEK